MFKRVLIVVAHPDDEILGCGGLLAKYSKTSAFRVVFIAEGSSCRFEATEESEISAAIQARTESAISALKSLGVRDIHFTNKVCGKLDQTPILELNKCIEKHISEFKPTSIISHSAKDANSDHRRVSEAALMATRPGALNTVTNLFACEILSSSEWAFLESFSPNYFITLTQEDLHKKISALEIYESEIREFPFPRSARGVTTLAQFRGMQSAQEFAESFQLIRSIQN